MQQLNANTKFKRITAERAADIIIDDPVIFDEFQDWLVMQRQSAITYRGRRVYAADEGEIVDQVLNDTAKGVEEDAGKSAPTMPAGVPGSVAPAARSKFLRLPNFRNWLRRQVDPQKALEFIESHPQYGKDSAEYAGAQKLMALKGGVDKKLFSMPGVAEIDPQSGEIKNINFDQLFNNENFQQSLSAQPMRFPIDKFNRMNRLFLFRWMKTVYSELLRAGSRSASVFTEPCLQVIEKMDPAEPMFVNPGNPKVPISLTDIQSKYNIVGNPPLDGSVPIEAAENAAPKSQIINPNLNRDPAETSVFNNLPSKPPVKFTPVPPKKPTVRTISIGDYVDPKNTGKYVPANPEVIKTQIANQLEKLTEYNSANINAKKMLNIKRGLQGVLLAGAIGGGVAAYHLTNQNLPGISGSQSAAQNPLGSSAPTGTFPATGDGTINSDSPVMAPITPQQVNPASSRYPMLAPQSNGLGGVTNQGNFGNFHQQTTPPPGSGVNYHSNDKDWMERNNGMQQLLREVYAQQAAQQANQETNQQALQEVTKALAQHPPVDAPTVMNEFYALLESKGIAAAAQYLQQMSQVASNNMQQIKAATPSVPPDFWKIR